MTEEVRKMMNLIIKAEELGKPSQMKKEGRKKVVGEVKQDLGRKKLKVNKERGMMKLIKAEKPGKPSQVKRERRIRLGGWVK